MVSPGCPFGIASAPSASDFLSRNSEDVQSIFQQAEFMAA